MANWRRYVTEEENDIIKSNLDGTKYRVLKLTNGMRICLMSSPKTAWAAATMDVHVGSMSDPDDIPGLAHLCEHLLFMGSEKYPAENDFKKLIEKHSGRSNGTTFEQNTNYYFSIKSNYLSEALDRFAQFFVCPLFTETAIEKEINMVNYENEGHATDDEYCMQMVDMETMNPDHPYSRFSTGNKETLLNMPVQRGQNIQTEVMKFHEKYYSSNVMSLAVFGAESLDELAVMVVRLFSQVKNKSVSVPICRENSMRDMHTQLQINIVPNSDIKKLTLTWPVEAYSSFPCAYVQHLMDVCGPGSLRSLLKSKGWVTLVESFESTTVDLSFFNISMDLTDEGMGHMDEIIASVFQYINMLRKEGAQKWIWDECTKMAHISFSYEEPMEVITITNDLAYQLRKLSNHPAFSAKDIITDCYLFKEFQACHINCILQQMAPRKVRVIVQGKEFEGRTDHVEKWYGTPYSVHKIPESTLQKWECAGINEHFHLPTKNEFIPSNFELQTVSSGSSLKPRLIKESSFTSLWYKASTTPLPQSRISLCISGQRNKIDPFNIDHYLHMFAALLNDKCGDQFYSAKLAGLDYSIEYDSKHKSIILRIEGFSDKQKILLEKIMHTMATFSVNSDRFHIIRELYIDDIESINAKQPYEQAIHYADDLLTRTGRGTVDHINDMSIYSLTTFIADFLSSIHIDMLVSGNMSQEQAIELLDVAERCMHTVTATPLNIEEITLNQIELLPGRKYLYQHQQDVHSMSALLVYYQCITVGIHEKMLLHLFCKLIEEPCFDILRTKQQLGYHVHCYVREKISGISGLSICVQSDKHPQYLEEKVDEFLRDMGGFIQNMPCIEFQNHINALASSGWFGYSNEQYDHKFSWHEIKNRQYQFNRNIIESEYIKTLTKYDVCEFYKRCIAEESPLRRKLSVYVIGNEQTSTDIQQKNEANEAFNMNDLKFSLES